MPIERLSDLALFVQVVQGGNLSEAGRQLGLSPATASKRLTRLEEALGMRLVTRTTRQVRPTEDGRAFFERAVRILGELEEAEDAARASTREPRGALKITMPASFGRMHVLPIINDFLKKYSQVSVDAVLTDSVIDLVAEGVDVAIRIAELKDSSLIARKLCENPRIICAAPSYLAEQGTPLEPRDLASHRCLRLHGQEIWRFSHGRGQETVRVNGPLTTNNGDAIKRACIDGLGISMKSLWDVGPDIRAGRLIELLLDFEVDRDVAIYAVYPSSRHVSARARAFLDFIVAAFTPAPPWETV